MNLRTLTALPLVLLLAACPEDRSSSESKTSAAVERQQTQLINAQPIPAFDFSLERDTVIQLYQARNQNVGTHTVWLSITGTVLGDCPSIGYPIPYDTSLTNPLRAEWRSYQGVSGVTIEQPEPNGIYPSKNSTATWVRCVLEDGTVAPIYIEAQVNTYPGPVDVDYTTNRVQLAGQANVTIQQPNR